MCGHSDDGSYGIGTILEKGWNEWIVNPLKDVTGASAAEDANEAAQAEIDRQKAESEKQRQNILAENATEQLRLSRQAGVARKSGSTSATRSSTEIVEGSSIGEDEKEFLGL